MMNNELSNENHKYAILSRKVNKHLFSLQQDEEEGKQVMKQLRKKYADYNL
jgi:hypothetical protein